MIGLGKHLIIDALSDKSLSERAILAFLEMLPVTIEMTPIMPPYIYRTDGGWAGIQLIAESHIALHSKGKEVHLDVFSCKDFETGAAFDLAVKMLGLEKTRTQTLVRGWAVARDPERIE